MCICHPSLVLVFHHYDALFFTTHTVCGICFGSFACAFEANINGVISLDFFYPFKFGQR